MLGVQKLGWALSYHQAELSAPATAAAIGGGLIENRLEIWSTADNGAVSAVSADAFNGAAAACAA